MEFAENLRITTAELLAHAPPNDVAYVRRHFRETLGSTS
jgi:hypothetical protein